MVLFSPTHIMCPMFQVLVATVEEKENAAKKYQSAVAEGSSGGLVQQDARNSNQVAITFLMEFRSS